MQLVEHLLRVARALLVKRLLALLAKRVLHLDEEVVVLDLRLGHALLVGFGLLHQSHVVLQVCLLLQALLLLLALVVLRLNVGFLVFLPKVHLVGEFLVRCLHLKQVLLNLLYDLLRLAALRAY